MAAERLENGESAIFNVGVVVLRWAVLGAAVFAGVILLQRGLPKAWNIYLDVRYDRPAQRRFMALGPLIMQCQEAINVYAVGTSPGHNDHEISRRLTVANEKSLQLYAELNNLGISPGSLVTTTGSDWRLYLARLAVKAEHGDLEGARRLSLK